MYVVLHTKIKKLSINLQKSGGNSAKLSLIKQQSKKGVRCRFLLRNDSMSVESCKSAVVNC